MVGQKRQDRLRRTYWRSVRLWDEGIRIALATFLGFWLGLFDRRTLELLDQEHYDGVRRPVGDVLVTYADRRAVEQGLKDWEQRALDEHFPSAGRLVVTGAGAGREVLALSRKGFDVVGYEPHEGLVAAGSEHLSILGIPNALFTMGRTTFPEIVGPVDGVIVGWGSYMLRPGRSRRVEFLRRARGQVRPGTPVLLSFFVREDAGERHYRRIHRVASIVRRLRRAERPELGDTLDPAFVHAFDRADIEAELVDAGFELVEYRAQPYGYAVGRAV